MISNANDEKLILEGVSEDYIFFYQLWKELTYEKTMDSYQFRVMNILSVMDELSRVVQQRLGGLVKTSHNVQECRQEAIDIIRKDPVMKRRFSSIKGRMLSHLNTECESTAQLKALQYRLEIYYADLSETYMTNLIECIEEDIQTHDYKDLVLEINSLVSICVTTGWSSKALYGIADYLKNETNPWQTFKDRLLNKDIDEYGVIIPLKVKLIPKTKYKSDVPISRVIDALEKANISVMGKGEVHEEFPEITEALGNTFMVVTSSAHDYYSASHEAIAKCSKVLNALSFYNVIEAWSVREISWFVYNKKNKSYKNMISQMLYGTYDYMEAAPRHFIDSIEIQSRGESQIAQRLAATYSYANMGKASYSQEEKYITTWVALESLCRTDVFDNIISNVLETVPPALCRRYIHMLVRNFYEDCCRCKVQFDGIISDLVVVHSRNETVKNMIEAFNDVVKFNYLLTQCAKESRLLKYRCEELHDILTEPSKMFDKVENHYQNVRRQLSRLYRIRNEIAHSATNSTYIVRYIEHLDDYLASFVSEIVLCTKEKNLERIEHVLEITKDNYNQFKEFAAISRKKQGIVPQLSDFMKTGKINLI